MKRILPAFIFALLITGFYSCNKTTETNNAALCNNGMKDGRESEIDCGVDCTPCPGVATLSCTLGSGSYVGISTAGQILGPSLRIYSVDNGNRPLNFMFIPKEVNQPTPISSVAFSYQGEPYHMGDVDTGVVILTSLDTLRKIASGTFHFTAKRLNGTQTCNCTDGVFANARYGAK